MKVDFFFFFFDGMVKCDGVVNEGRDQDLRIKLWWMMRLLGSSFTFNLTFSITPFDDGYFKQPSSSTGRWVVYKLIPIIRRIRFKALDSYNFHLLS